MNIRDVIEMLNYNNPLDIQQAGIKLALHTSDLKTLLEYSEFLEYGDNIAKVFTSLTYEQNSIYVDDFFSWIEDLNTPGADLILNYLENAPGKWIENGFRRAFYAANKSRDKHSVSSLKIIFWKNSELQKKLKEKSPEIYSICAGGDDDFCS